MKYIKLDGTSFNGDVFHPDMETVGILDPDTKIVRHYRSLYSRTGELLYRMELKVDGHGYIIYPEEEALSAN